MRVVLYLHPGNDSVLELLELTNAVSGAVESDASVSVTLLDASAGEVDGQAWPQIMEPVVDAPGNYRCSLSSLLDITHGARYTAVVSAISAGGVRARWDVEVRGQLRRAEAATDCSA